MNHGEKSQKRWGPWPPHLYTLFTSGDVAGGDATSPPSHFFPFQGAQLQHKARGMPFNSLLPLPPPPPPRHLGTCLVAPKLNKATSGAHK